jgi:hypothetical protein
VSPLEQTDVASALGGEPVVAAELRPELERLGVVVGRPPSSLSGELTVGASTVRLDGWERMVLRAYGIGSDARGRPWPTLVAHAIALRLRGASRDPAPGAACVPEERARVVAGLREEAALACSVLAELEWSRSRLTDEGETRLATRLTELIDRVDRTVTHLRDFLGDPSPAPPVVAPFDPGYRDRWPEIRPAAESGTSPASRRSVRRRTIRLEPGPKSLVTIAVFAVTVAAVVFFVPLGPGRPEPTAAGLGPVFRLPAVIDASAVEGTTTVTIDAGTWARLSEPRREEMLQTIGATARAAGHPRVELRTADGRPVATNRPDSRP